LGGGYIYGYTPVATPLRERSQCFAVTECTRHLQLYCQDVSAGHKCFVNRSRRSAKVTSPSEVHASS